MPHQASVIIAKPELITKIFWLSLGLIALGIGIFSIGKPIGNYPEWLSPWVFHLGGIGVGLLSLAKWMMMKTVILRKDDLEVSNFFGLNQRIIPRSQVIKMIEIEKSGEDSKWKECTLLTNYGKIKLSGQAHTSYEEIIRALREQWQVKEETAILANKHSKNKLVQGIVNLAIGGAIFMCLQQIKAVYELAPRSELMEIKSRIINDLSLTPTGTSDNSISILLEAYQGFNFKMDSYAKSVISKNDFEQIATKGDSIILTISKRDFQKKLAKTQPLNIWEQYINYQNITIYGLRNEATMILNPDEYCSAVSGLRDSNPWISSSFFYILIFIFTLEGIKNIYEYMKAIM